MVIEMKNLLTIAVLIGFAHTALADGINNPGGSPAAPVNSVQYNKGFFAGSANHLFYDTAIPAPAAPTLTVNGTAGTKHRGYTVVGVGGLGYGLSSPMTQTLTSNATLSATNFVTVQTSAVVGATSCDVFQITNPTQAGFGTYIGNIPCGNSINDKGSASTPYPASPIPPSGSTAVVQVDNSAGVYLNNNIVTTGNMALGNGALLGHVVNNTSGNTVLSLAQTNTGSGSANSAPDVVNLQSLMTIAPAGVDYIDQAWNAQLLLSVPSTNTSHIAALEGIYSSIQMSGSGGLDTGDSIFAQVSIGGSVASDVGPIDAGNFGITDTSSGHIVNLTGVVSGVFIFGSGGVDAAYDYDTNEVQNGGSGASTLFVGYHAALPVTTGVGAPANYAAFQAEDSHTVGSTTSYGIHIVGELWKNLIEGQLQVGALVNKGTKFTLSGCSATTTVGGAATGQFASGTTGTCTAVITIAGATGETAPNGWSCWANDLTTPADVIHQTASNATTATLSGTTISGDTINFGCVGY